MEVWNGGSRCRHLHRLEIEMTGIQPPPNSAEVPGAIVITRSLPRLCLLLAEANVKRQGSPETRGNAGGPLSA